jgi:hypothetical protein
MGETSVVNFEDVSFESSGMATRHKKIESRIHKNNSRLGLQMAGVKADVALILNL